MHSHTSVRLSTAESGIEDAIRFGDVGLRQMSKPDSAALANPLQQWRQRQLCALNLIRESKSEVILENRQHPLVKSNVLLSKP